METKTNVCKMFNILYIFFILLPSYGGNFLDIDELASTNYEIDILDTPIPTTQSEDLSQLTVRLSSRFGQQYQCTYQPADDSQTSHKEQVALETGIVELLRPMSDQPCLVQVRDWWTYEFCFGKHVKQYHTEATQDGKIVGPVLFLGLFDSDYDWDNNTQSKGSKKLNRYHSQQYVNGTICDLTGKPRKVEVRFLCADGLRDEITRIDEPETCVYTMTVHTTKICHHPYLRQVKAAEAIPITCQPLLSEGDYKIYTMEIEAQKEAKRLQMQQRIGNLLSKDTDDTSADDDTAVSGLGDIQKMLESFGGLINEDTKVVKLSSPEDNPTDDDDVDNEDAGDDTSDESENLEDHEILTDFTKGLDDITTSKAVREHLSKYKDTLSSAMQAQFAELVQEAQGEVGEELADQQTAFDDLSNTLDKLLSKLEKTEKDLQEVEDQIEMTNALEEKLKKEIAENSAPETPGEESDEDGDIDSDIDPAVELEDIDKGTNIDKETSPSVRVSVSQMKRVSTATKGKDDPNDPNIEDEEGTETDLVIESESRRKLEQKMSSKLQKAGLDTGGRQIEVKIITTGYDGDDADGVFILSDDETTAFSDMIVKMVGGSSAATRETERHNKLVQNYGFIWKKDDQLTDSHNNEVGNTILEDSNADKLIDENTQENTDQQQNRDEL